jgi:WD40 repeat protein
MSIAAGLCIAVGLGTVAWFQKQESNHQAQIVEARQLLSDAEGLRDDDGAHGQYAASLRIATKALVAFDRLGEPTLDADLSLRKSYVRMEKWTDLDTGHLSYDASAFDTTGRIVGLILGGREIMLWDTQKQQRLASCKIDMSVGQSGRALSVSTGGHWIAAYLYNSSKQDTSSTITVWSLPDCQPHLSVTVPRNGADGLLSMALTPDGTTLVVLSRDGLDFWDIATQTSHRITSDARIDMIAPAPDSSRIATYEYRKANKAEHAKATRLVRIQTVPAGEILQTLQIPHHPSGTFAWTGITLLVGKQRITFDQGSPTLANDPDIKGDRRVLSHDGQRIATWVDSKSIEIRDASTADLIARTTRSANISVFTFASDNRALVTLDPAAHQIGLWQFEIPGSYARLQPSGDVRKIGFSDTDEHLIAKGSEAQQYWHLPAPGTGDAPLVLSSQLYPCRPCPGKMPLSLPKPTAQLGSAPSSSRAAPPAADPIVPYRSGRERLIWPSSNCPPFWTLPWLATYNSPETAAS